jgi:hypothetical protein
MKVYEILPTKKTFYLMPEPGENSDTRLTVDICYDTQQVIIKGHLNPIIIDVQTKCFVDPITTLLSYDKNDILHHMGIHPNLSLHQSFSKTMINIENKAKTLGIPTHNFQSDIYDEMIATHKTYSEIYSFETLCSVLRKHKVLSEFADELIEEIYLWPEYHECIADVIIDKLFPVLKTVPPIKTNAILVECR